MGAAAGPNVVEDGLVLALDAGNTKSYDSYSIITYVGGTSDSDNSSSFTFSGLQSGDLVLYFSAEDAAPVSTPTGASWTAIPGLVTQPDNDGGPHSAAFYVFATGTSVTASGLNTGNENVRVMIAFRNVNSTNPFDVNATENSGSGLPDPPSITPVTDNSMIVAVGLLDDHAIANSISPPTGYTTALNMDSDGGADDTGLGAATIMTAYKLLATAAAEDPGGFTGTTGDPQKGISIALRPATNTTWTDISGNGNTGTLTGGPTYSSDDGGSIVFDGVDDYITLGTQINSDIQLTDVTISFWAYIDSTAADEIFVSMESLTLNRPLIIWYDTSSSYEVQNTGIGDVGGGSNNVITTAVTDASSEKRFTTSNNALSANTWYNIVVVLDVTNNEFYTYINGVEEAKWVSNNTSGGIKSTTNDFRIGGGNPYLDGRISNFSVYNKALTAAEIQQNYTALKGRYGY